MMYLSRIRLDRNAPAKALYGLLEPEAPGARMDAHHRLVWTLFPAPDGHKRDFLWRAEGAGRFMVLSARPPQANDLFHQPLESKEFAPSLSPGDQLAFVLRVNATRDRPTSKLQDGRHRRVDVLMHALHAVPRDERAVKRFALAGREGENWLSRQGTRNGFDLNSFQLEDYSTVPLPARRSAHTRHGANFGIFDMSGVLTVNEPKTFINRLYAGFGRARGFGCGLMLIRRA